MGYGTLVVTSEPTNYYNSPYDPIIYECTWGGSTTTDPITNVRMQAVVTYGDDGATLGTQTKQSISVSGTETFRFNFAEMLKTVLSYEFYNNISSDQINAPATAGDNRINNTFIVTFTPKYTDVNGDNQDDTTVAASVRYVSNVIIPRDDTTRVLNASSQWLAQSSTSKFLTHSPQNKIIREGEDEQLSFIHDTGNQVEYNYQTYDLGGNANAAQTKALVTTDWRYGTLTISDNGASTVIDDFANISKIDVWIEDSTGTQLTEKKTYLIKQGCEKGYRLWWGNSLGGYDKYTFRDYYNSTYVVDNRLDYTKPKDSTPTLEERSKTTLGIDGNQHFKASSGFISNEWMDFMKDLMNSTELYYQPYTSTGFTTEIHPVVITSKEMVLEDSEGMIKMDIDFSYSEKEKTMIG